MKKPVKIMLIGIILLIAGIAGGIGVFFATLKDPSEVAKETVVFETYDLSETATLSKGDYDIWCESGFLGLGGDPGDVEITDSNDNLVWERPSSYTTESIEINGNNYMKVGSFSLSSTDDYTISVEYSGVTLFFTEPINVMTGIGLCVTGVLVGVIGGVIMLVGVFYFFKDKKAAQYPAQQYQYQQPYYPQQQYQQPQQQYQQPQQQYQQPQQQYQQPQQQYQQPQQQYQQPKQPNQQPPQPAQTPKPPPPPPPELKQKPPQSTVAAAPPPPPPPVWEAAPPAQITTYTCPFCQKPFTSEISQLPKIVNCPSCTRQVTVGG
jgi:hypothetical protein